MRRIKWSKNCTNCGFHTEGDDEYLGGIWWYCPKCNSLLFTGVVEVYEK